MQACLFSLPTSRLVPATQDLKITPRLFLVAWLTLPHLRPQSGLSSKTELPQAMEVSFPLQKLSQTFQSESVKMFSSEPSGRSRFQIP